LEEATDRRKTDCRMNEYVCVLSRSLIAYYIRVGSAVRTSDLVYFHNASKYGTDLHG
jgi:hypothetical protein